jgi:hypothetical protein
VAERAVWADHIGDVHSISWMPDLAVLRRQVGPTPLAGDDAQQLCATTLSAQHSRGREWRFDRWHPAARPIGNNRLAEITPCDF